MSNVKSYDEGHVMIWFLEDYRDDVVLAGMRHRFAQWRNELLAGDFR